MTLGEKQRAFVHNIGRLIIWAYGNDLELSFGEAQRSVAQAQANAAAGTGISNSLHLRRLAIDLNLFKDLSLEGDEDIYQTDSGAYYTLGQYWKSLHPLNRWGGDFSKPDGNHFSMEHEGVR
jgi:hypothetical protein